jgi:hypothetical protein
MGLRRPWIGLILAFAGAWPARAFDPPSVVYRASDDAEISNLTTVGGRLCFFVRHLPPGAGTEQSDVFCGSGSADPGLLARLPENVTPAWAVGVGDVLLFLALDADQARTLMLWRSPLDGGGAVRVPELSDVRGPLLAQGGAAYVIRAAAAALPALWRTDGTPAGSELRFDVPISFWQSAGVLRDGLYFVDFVGNVFVTDPGVSRIDQLLGPSGRFLYSVATSSALHTVFENGGRWELWRSDGSADASSLVASHPAPYPSVGGQVWESGGRTYYTAYDDELRWTLWVADDTSSTGSPLAATATQPECFDHHMFGRICFQTGLFILGSVNDRLIFQLDATTWLTDGTVDGTVPLGVFVGSGGVEMNGTWFFEQTRPGSADYEFVHELWATDGTAVGTVRVSELPGEPSGFTLVGNRLFFLAARSLFSLEVPCGDPALDRSAKALCDLRALRRALACSADGPRVRLRKRPLHGMERLLRSALRGQRTKFLRLDRQLERLSSRITDDAGRLGMVCADGLLERVRRLRARIAGLGA